MKKKIKVWVLTCDGQYCDSFEFNEKPIPYTGYEVSLGTLTYEVKKRKK